LALDLSFALVFIEVQLQIKAALKGFGAAMKPQMRVLAGELRSAGWRFSSSRISSQAVMMAEKQTVTHQ